MSNKKLETEENSSLNSFKPISEDFPSHKKPETKQEEIDKENIDSQNTKLAEKLQSFKPKSIGHYILG